MSFLSNAHTHSTYCDGKSAIDETVRAAQKLGFVSLGFSGHAYQGFDLKYCMSPEHQSQYRAELRCLQDKLGEWGLAPKLYVGLEQDSLVPDEEKADNRAQFDYLIGSTHYLPVELDGERPAVDGNTALLKRAIAECYDGDALAMAQVYYDLHASTFETDKPDIVGHFDIVRKYADEIGLDVACKRYRDMALNALERIARTDAVLEVNTGAIARGQTDTPFPADFLLEAWRDLGGRLTLTSDCHDCRLLDCAFDETTARLKRLGFTSLQRLGTGSELWDTVEI